MTKDIPATYMRGGASKGVFFLARDLPSESSARDALLLRVVGSPDPYQRHVDGMGIAGQGNSKVVLVASSLRDDCDVDASCGVVSTLEPVIDYGSLCGDLMAAVGPFAITQGLVTATEPMTCVRIWQQQVGQRIDAWIPVRDGMPLEAGVFREDGVPFPAAEVRLDLYPPQDSQSGLPMLLTGQVLDTLTVPGVGALSVTMVSSGSPTLFVLATELGLTGRESPDEVNGNRRLLKRLEQVTVEAAGLMGLPEPPQLAWVAPPAAYRSAGGHEIPAASIDVLARTVTGGKLHPAYPEPGSVALAAAAALPGSVVNTISRALPGVATRIGHVSGTLSVGAQVVGRQGNWHLEKAMLSRSARRLMTGFVHVG
jgi:2-methylaconitate cis-trans-isomerase PrpF